MSRDVLEIRVATYFGKPIPLLHSLVGNPIKWTKMDGSRHTKPHPCGPFGSRLGTVVRTDIRFRVQRAIAALARRINGVQVEETSYGVFYRELTQAQLQQVTDRVPYRDHQGMVPDLRRGWDLAFHGLGGTSTQYYELKGLRASKNTCPRGPNTDVAKRAASVQQVEHVRKLRKLDQKLYGNGIDSASALGPTPEALSGTR
jgi:hypothetical protein